MARKSKGLYVLIIAVIIAAVTGIAAGAVKIYDHYYGMHKVTVSTGQESSLAEGQYRLFYNGSFQGSALVDEEGVVFVDIDSVNEEWAGGRLFYAEDVGKVFYTTQTEVQAFETDGTQYTVKDGAAYISTETAAEMFGMPCIVVEEANLVIMETSTEKVGDVYKSRTYLLSEPVETDRNYTAVLKASTRLLLYDSGVDGFYYAVDNKGNMGYIQEDKVAVSDSGISPKDVLALDMSQYLLDGTVRAAFQPFYSADYSDSTYTDVEACGYYVNVVIPTWFKLQADGSVESYAQGDYADWLHYQGYDVWGLIDNSFDDALTLSALKSTAQRSQLCDTLLTYCQELGLDGINVDFEGLSEETEVYFTQFLRELAVKLRTSGYLLTVDTMVPSDWTSYYQRSVMDEVCDYVIVMAYDEHYDGSDAGSTSSQSFTTQAVVDMEEEGVSKDKLILGIPWYTRVWMGLDNLRSEAAGMDEAAQIVEDNGLTQSYDQETGQNYAEGMVGETLYRIWLEDETSQTWRAQIAKDSGLAGVAAWAMGFEGEDAWVAWESVFFSESE